MMRAWPVLVGGAVAIGVIGYLVTRPHSSAPATPVPGTVNMLPPPPSGAIGPTIRHIITTTSKHVTVGPTSTPAAPSFTPG